MAAGSKAKQQFLACCKEVLRFVQYLPANFQPRLCDLIQKLSAAGSAAKLPSTPLAMHVNAWKPDAESPEFGLIYLLSATAFDGSATGSLTLKRKAWLPGKPPHLCFGASAHDVRAMICPRLLEWIDELQAGGKPTPPLEPGAEPGLEEAPPQLLREVRQAEVRNDCDIVFKSLERRGRNSESRNVRPLSPADRKKWLEVARLLAEENFSNDAIAEVLYAKDLAKSESVQVGKNARFNLVRLSKQFSKAKGWTEPQWAQLTKYAKQTGRSGSKNVPAS